MVNVTAVILCYNAGSSIDRVMESVWSQSVRPATVVVVDNHSSDDTVARVERAARLANTSIRLVRLPENLGVGGGHNAGWRLALSDDACDLLWALEHDSVPDSRCLEHLITTFERDPHKASIGAIASAMCATASELQTTAARDADALPTMQRIVTFNGTLIPRATVMTHGMLRDDFFVGQEDREFSQRLLRAGLRLVRCSTAKTLHENAHRPRGSNQTVPRAFYSNRNAIYLSCLGGPKVRRAAILREILLLPLTVGKAFLIRDQRFNRSTARCVAAVDGIRGKLGRQNYWFLRK